MKKLVLTVIVLFVALAGFQAFATADWLDLEGVQNARQLSGSPTRSGGTANTNMLLRTGELASMTDADRALLMSAYQLSQIIDLRDEVEAETAPDPDLQGVQYHHLNVWPRAVRARLIEESTVNGQVDSALYTRNYYTAFALEPAAIAAYREMFAVLLQNEAGSVLIHCVHGKDRTGIAAVLILSALDVPWDVIEQDYLMSNAAFEGSVDASSLAHYRRVIEEGYGSIENYLEAEMGLTEKDLLTLRKKYTEGAN